MTSFLYMYDSNGADLVLYIILIIYYLLLFHIYSIVPTYKLIGNLIGGGGRSTSYFNHLYISYNQ